MMLRATNVSRSTAASSRINHRTSVLGWSRYMLETGQSFVSLVSGAPHVRRTVAFGWNRCVLGGGRSFATDVVVAAASEAAPVRRLPTAMERVRNFPAGVKLLYQDILRYKNIHDASRTRLNAWTIQTPLSRGNDGRLPFLIIDDEIRPGRIPRREYNEQLRLKDDLRKVGPVLLLWIPPGIGYIAMFLVVLAPRQALSRQFYSGYEQELYASMEYRQCKSHFRALAEHVFGSVMVNVHSLDIPVQGQDAAGPILDLLPYYSMFSHVTTEDASVEDARLSLSLLPTAGKLAAPLETYPREHLISLALANGLYQSFPDPLSRLFTSCCPWLRGEVRRIANLIATDDKLLLEEAYDSNGCESMMDPEVLDACRMRGLPVTVSYAEMRRCLTNHLTMIQALRERLPNNNNNNNNPHTTPEGLKLLTLHLSALRYYLREERQSSS